MQAKKRHREPQGKRALDRKTKTQRRTNVEIDGHWDRQTEKQFYQTNHKRNKGKNWWKKLSNKRRKEMKNDKQTDIRRDRS